MSVSLMSDETNVRLGKIHYRTNTLKQNMVKGTDSSQKSGLTHSHLERPKQA